MTRLYLVRHGETDWNRQRRIQGRTDIPLNDTGRAQAMATGRRLAALAWDGILASPLQRAFETAAIIAGEVGLGEPETVPALVERDYGEAEGMTDAELDARYGPGVPVPGRETRGDVADRVVPALVELAATRAGRLVVASHGGAIRAVLTRVDPANEYGPITNGSVHSFELVGDRLELVAFDDPVGSSLDEQNAIEAREDGMPGRR